MPSLLEDIFDKHTGRLIHKLSNYFDIYEKYFSKYIGEEVVILEIGISHGGSLEMWQQYFGNNVKIFAIDINPDCKKLESDRVKIFIGSQENKNFLEGVIQEMPAPHIIIDDGGHTMKQQIITFETLYPYLKNEGIYLCEDTGTSYWYEYGGGVKRKNTFIEYAKTKIDYLHAWHFKSKKIKVNNFTSTTQAIHFYDNIVIFEKKFRSKPESVQRGEKTIDHNEDPLANKRNLWHRIIKKFYSLKSLL